MLDEKELLCEVLFLLWWLDKINNVELLNSFKREKFKMTIEKIDKAFDKVQELGFGKINIKDSYEMDLVYQNWQETFDDTSNVSKTDVALWQKILSLDFAHVNKCPKEILKHLNFDQSLKNTVEFGVFENKTEDDLFFEILFILWQRGEALNVAMSSRFNTSTDVVNKIFEKILKLGFTDLTQIDGFGTMYELKIKKDLYNKIDDRKLSKIIARKASDNFKTNVIVHKPDAVEIEIWQILIDHDFKYATECPEDILPLIVKNDSLRKTVQMGVFEKRDTLEERILANFDKPENDHGIFASRFVEEVFGKEKNRTLYAKEYSDLKVKIFKIFQKLKAEGILVQDPSNNAYLLKTKVIERWKKEIEKFPDTIFHCPKWVLEILKPAIAKIRDTGVFESLNMKDEDFLKIDDYEARVYAKMATFGDSKLNSSSYSISHFYSIGIPDNKVMPLIEKMVAEGKLEIENRKYSDMKTGVEKTQMSGVKLLTPPLEAWSIILKSDISCIRGCPKEYAIKLGYDNMQKVNNVTGVFENTSFRELLNSAPEELRNIVWQQWKAPQNPKFHPEGNTLKHIMTVVNRAIAKYPDNINLILAAFFHDLGKFKSLGWKNGVPTQHGHEDISTQLVNRFKDWIVSQGGDVEEIEYIVSNHMKIKPNTWDVMKQKKKDIITNNPAYKNLTEFGKIDKGGLFENKKINMKTEELFESISFEDVEFDYTDYKINESMTNDDFNPELEPKMAGQLVDKDKIESFMFAGKAIFTIRNNQTENRFTFRVTRPKRIKDDVYFVSVLTGGNNENCYTFFGTIFDKKRFKLSAKTKLETDSLSIKAFMWFWKTLLSNQPFPPQIQIWHEGVCGKCGKKLTVPESIDIGLGPICARSADLWQRSARLVDVNNKSGVFDSLVHTTNSKNLEIYNDMKKIHTFENFLNESELKKEKKFKQLEKDWQDIYKLNKKVLTALRKVKSEKGYGDEFSSNPFDEKIKTVLSKFDISNLKIKGIGTGYEVSFNIADNKFKFEFFTNGKLVEDFDGAQEIKESTVLDEIFLGRKLKEVKDTIDSFRIESSYNIGDKTIVAVDEFSTLDVALNHLISAGYAVGKMQGNAPIGAAKGAYDIQKWRNIGNDADKLDAIVVKIDKEYFIFYFTFPEL